MCKHCLNSIGLVIMFLSIAHISLCPDRVNEFMKYFLVDV